MLAGDCLLMGDLIVQKWHHLFSVAYVIFGGSDAMMLRVTIMVELTARA